MNPTIKRVPIEEIGLIVTSTWPEVSHGHIVTTDPHGNRELWVRNRRALGYTIVWDGNAYEYVRPLSTIVVDSPSTI